MPEPPSKITVASLYFMLVKPALIAPAPSSTYRFSHAPSRNASKVVAERVMAPPPWRGDAADCTAHCQKGKALESIPPTVPVPASATSAWSPLTWLVSVPSLYTSALKLFLNVRIEFLILALTRLISLACPLLIRMVSPSATTLTAICFQGNSAAEMTSLCDTFSTSKPLYL